MIVGVGTDIVDIERIALAGGRHGERFPLRILGEQELPKYYARRAQNAGRGLAFLATRFAAKEAFSKAIGLGMRMPMHWRAVQILNARSGRPIAVTDAVLSEWMRERGWTAEISISDERAYGVAFVVVSKTM